MRIRMLSPPDAALDDVPEGIRLDDFHANQVYDVSPSLATFFIACGWARGEMRSGIRRHLRLIPHSVDRRRLSDRRSSTYRLSM